MIHKPRKPRNDNLVMANFLQRPHQWSIGGKRRGLFWQAYLHAKGRYEYKSGHFLTDVDLPVSPWCRHRSARAAQRCAQLAAPRFSAMLPD